MGLAGTQEVVHFPVQEGFTSAYLNMMSQYHPSYKAFDITQLSRSMNQQEFSEAIKMAR